MILHRGSVSIVEVRIVPIDSQADRYAVEVIFECADCGKQYGIGDEDRDKLDIFVNSLQEGNPTRDISCPNCAQIYKN